MSTLVEIEAAIERLPAVQVAELAAWLEEYQPMIQASASVFAEYDARGPELRDGSTRRTLAG